MRNRISAFSCCLVLFTAHAPAITPADLKQKLEAGERITLVDVRSTTLFKQGHIVNAINVPAQLVPQKQLPPLGSVVVYDDGLGPDTASQAAAALNQRPGISAEVLEGGFAAWETAQASTTKAAGLSAEELPYVTYDKLKKTRAADMVLVDLRKPPTAPAALAGSAPGAKAAVTAQAEPLTDLSKEFPNTRVVRSPFDTETRKAAGTGASAAAQGPLLVLIDSGDGSAQEMARALKANGNKRFVILAGGEEIIARKGEPGLQRAGASYTVNKPRSAAAPGNN